MSTPRSFSLRRALAPRGPTLSSINLLADQRDGPLIDWSSIPGLKRAEVGFARLIAKGDLALVTNRADSSISVIGIDGNEIKVLDTIAMGDSVARRSSFARTRDA